MATKNKLPLYVSPAGTAVYPWLNKPDFKFNSDGVYSVKMVFSKDKAKKMNDIIKPLMNGGRNNPLKPEKDDQGEPTGNYVASFSMYAHVKTKGGDEWDQKPALVDTVGNRVESLIGGGSKLQVAFQAAPYPKELQGGGVKLRLKKVKVLELVEYKSKDDTDWGEEEEGSYKAATPDEKFAEAGVDDEEDF